MTLEDEKVAFILVTKRILKTNLTKNKETLSQYGTDIIAAHNRFVRYINSKFDSATPENKLVYTDHLNWIRDKIQRCLVKLKLSYEFASDISQLIVGSEVTEKDEESTDENTDRTTTDSETDDQNNSDKETRTMPQDAEQFLRLCAQNINVKYTGDPLGLPSFLNSVALLEQLVKDENKTLLTTFVISKLDGKALEAIASPGTATLQQVKDSLKDKIKPDNSEIIEGRILALRQDKMTMQEFAKQAEELADALKRTYIVEGMTSEKAGVLTVKKTIELCRSNTRSVLVKSVLAATHFEDSKSVIAKLVVESATDVKERQVLSFQAHRGNNRNSYRGNFRGNNLRGRYNGNNNRRGYQDGYQKGYQNNYQSSYDRSSQNSWNNSTYNSGNNRGNFRGRSRGRYNGNNNNRHASVRFMETGNPSGPQQRPLGDTMTQNSDM